MDRWTLGLLSFRMSFKSTPDKIARLLESKGRSEKNNLEYVTPETVRVSCVQLRLRGYASLKEYTEEMYQVAKTAADAGAQLIVFPEYVGLLAFTLIPGYRRLLSDLLGKDWIQGLAHAAPDPKKLHALAEAFHNFLFETYLYTFSTIARLLRVYLVAGTTLFYEEGQFVNRCLVFGPDGDTVGAQEKTCAIGLDRALGVTPSDLVETIQTPLGELGIVIGSDVYYFENFRILREKGAQIIAVPSSYTGPLRDLLRCRSNENGAYTIYACYVQEAEQQARAGIFAPIESTLSRNGVIAAAMESDTCAVTARTSLKKLVPPLTELEPNHTFIEGDYLHSYGYCGKLPLIDREG